MRNVLIACSLRYHPFLMYRYHHPLQVEAATVNHPVSQSFFRLHDILSIFLTPPSSRKRKSILDKKSPLCTHFAES